MVDRFTNAGFYSAVALAAINRLNLSRLDLSSVDYGLGEKFAIMLFLLFSICFQSKGIYIFMPNIEPVPAATVVLVRESPQQEDLEVLLLLRNSKLAFHGGHWVFPGGRVDKADFQDSADGLEYPAAQRAAVRETSEEAGIDILESQLVHTAHWTTPPNLARRFSTWFFVCLLTEAVKVNVDNQEILDHRWVSPSAALAEADSDLFVLPRPTAVTLQDIAPYKSISALNEYLNRGDIRVFPDDSPYYRPAEMGCDT